MPPALPYFHWSETAPCRWMLESAAAAELSFAGHFFASGGFGYRSALWESGRMIEVHADRAGGLFTFVFSQKVTAEEAKKWMTDIESRVAGMQSGFRLLADLSGLESMEVQCAP
ncbi:MAG TPA: hypothetical protein VGR78_08015, partial [Verrucomicrobiae bacterium]|nr:hypothetical protein [Verrucomicrobiae bacterium]